jgi:glycosyltransferase involved in cell wall biosynthesis
MRLTIIGDGPQREELTRLAEDERCTDWVKFTGQLSRSDLIDRLLETDVCVLPSLTESYCKARLDAMLCGVPVVTTEVGFGRQIIGRDGERGWLVSTGNAMSLAQVLYRILTEPRDWSSLRKRCREYAERFTLEGWVQEIGRICARNWNIQFENGKLET